ncbi:hypothetical protein KDW_64400 [Dictyobacter vulcani]|uniref:Major facilitator superfamily (MFS) profile domain-containing protein n=1 Tax=Dictyobacter vulcani TaxID=2607529 RepID=A0A5J4KRD6_9CHLR|nr:MFS transporter [Dictyobacter vulcani]GER92278.1 hypothetical protein KDW_64400 [Dictyobacter vulcani]
MAATIPRLIFVLIGGVTADRLPRRLIMLWSDGGRGFVVLLISILGFMGQLQFWHLIIEALIFGIVRFSRQVGLILSQSVESVYEHILNGSGSLLHEIFLFASALSVVHCFCSSSKIM